MLSLNFELFILPLMLQLMLLLDRLMWFMIYQIAQSKSVIS